jgi:hypothetical protein
VGLFGGCGRRRRPGRGLVGRIHLLSARSAHPSRVPAVAVATICEAGAGQGVRSVLSFRCGPQSAERHGALRGFIFLGGKGAGAGPWQPAPARGPMKCSCARRS